MDWLADKKESPWDPHAAKGYETAGHFFMLNRRYEESVAFYRKAIALDPALDSARSQLGVNLMRLGRDDEAYRQLKTCWDNGFKNSATKNSLTLMDSEKNFVTLRIDRTILKLHKKEADLLRPYFEAEMRRAIAVYEKKYRWQLTQPVQVEVYPDHEDFAVRALGMPGLGALGVTFGNVIAMDSPSGRPPGSFHWASVMWHEMSHVFTLSITNFHVPRWFTEGVAVHEETATSPEWGDRLGPEEIAAIKKHQLLPVAELDRGFVHPMTPQQVLVSYFEAGKICDYITEKWGWDTILAMLHDFGASDDTATVIRKELKLEPAEFDRQFIAALEAETKRTVENFDRWKEAVKHIETASAAHNYDEVIRLGTEARDLYPDYVEDHSIYESLANAYLAKGNNAAAIGQLERYVRHRRAQPGHHHAAGEEAYRRGQWERSGRGSGPAELYLSDAQRAASGTGRTLARAGERQWRHPRVSGAAGGEAHRHGSGALRSGLRIQFESSAGSGQKRGHRRHGNRSRIPAGAEAVVTVERRGAEWARRDEEIGLEEICRHPLLHRWNPRF